MSNEIKNVCFIFNTPVLNIYRERFCMNEFIKSGYSVYVIDISRITAPEAYYEVRNDLIDDDKMALLRSRSKKQYLEHMNSIPNDTFFLLAIPFGFSFRFVYRSLRHQRYGYICHADMILPAYSDSTTASIYKYIKSLSFSRIMETVFHRLPRRTIPYQKAEFTVMAGNGNEKALRSVLLADRLTKSLFLGGMDYRQYTETVRKNEPALAEGEYCVFIDEYIPYHPDGARIGFKIEPDLYYAQLRTLFLRLREKAGLDVIIAAHPRSDYSKHSECYEGFQVMKGCTCKLVCDSHLVLMHASLAASYVMLAGKPAALLTSNEIESNSYLSNSIKALSSNINAPIFNISCDNKDVAEKLISIKPDIEQYDRVIRDHIKQGYVRGKINDGFFQTLLYNIQHNCRKTV